MKKIFLILAVAGFISACDDDFDINRDPSFLTAGDVTLNIELPAGIAGVVGSQGSYYALIGGFWSQYWTQSNLANQYNTIDGYIIGTNDYNGGWTSMYDALGDIRNVKALATEQENWNYYLAATVLEVHASQIIADFYDELPYTQANDQNVLQPLFDKGPDAYAAMIADLQEALALDLSTSQGNAPGNDDFIFGGDMSNWTAFGNSLLLKLYMRQTEVNPTTAQAGITALIDSGADFLDTDAAMTQFTDAPNRSNPLYETDRRQLNVGTNLRASTTMLSYLEASSDPRRDAFYGEGISLSQGDYTNTSISGSSVAIVTLSPTDAVYLMSREESLFLQAEAAERYYGGAGAKALYDAAVTENFNKWGADASTFIAAGGAYEYPSAGTFDEKLEAIITQKWISGFPGKGFESFFEQNRTGYPVISDVPATDDAYIPGQFTYSVNGATGGEFPRRIVYPSDVRSSNQNAPDLVPITTPVWWDVN